MHFWKRSPDLARELERRSSLIPTLLVEGLEHQGLVLARKEVAHLEHAVEGVEEILGLVWSPRSSLETPMQASSLQRSLRDIL